MTDDIRERVAKAIFNAHPTNVSWDETKETNREVYRNRADAAIVTITTNDDYEAMVARGHDFLCEKRGICFDGFVRDVLDAAFWRVSEPWKARFRRLNGDRP